MPDQPPAVLKSELGVQTRQRLIELMAKLWGDKPSDAQHISAERELEMWLEPTSPAAEEVFKAGGSMETASRANAMYADWMKQQGATDDQIAQVTRAQAYQLGKINSRGDPGIEADWHAKMAERAQRAQVAQSPPTYQDVTGQQGGTDATATA